MKVILLQHVAKVGRKFDVVNVSDGYANNFLFPQKLAEMATPAREAELAKRREAAQAEEDARLSDLREKLGTLGEHTLTITMKADEQGHLYKKLHAADIVAALKDEYGIELSDDAVSLDEPFAMTGDREVQVRAAGETATVNVQVVAE